ncbi:MAG: hypothetical protein K1060chlam1_01030 [Candidatus Anoxychlamydiales bacterium]|nr:hypothetical protein [Candidatus Anoxychlamydiales bacterium]
MLDLVENKIKKNWLYALFVTCGLSMGFYYVSFFSNSTFRDLVGRNMFIFMIVFQTVFMLGWAYIYYRCAYKKPGRKFLAFHLIITPISSIFVILQMLNLFSFAPKVVRVNAIYDTSLFILGLAMGLVFFVFSLKLFKLNKKIKNRLATVSKD